MQGLGGFLTVTWTFAHLIPHTLRQAGHVQLSMRQPDPSEWPQGKPNAPLGQTDALQSRSYPAWPASAIAGRRELRSVLDAFARVAVTVPLDAASETGSQWERWLDGGFAAHKFIHKSISRQT